MFRRRYRTLHFFVVQDRKSKELAESMLQKLPEKITEEGELRALGLIGLGMKAEQIDRHLKDNQRDIRSAVFKVLMEWRTSQSDLTIAYEKMRDGLFNCNLSIHIPLLK